MANSATEVLDAAAHTNEVTKTREKIVASLRERGITNLDQFVDCNLIAYNLAKPKPWPELLPELSSLTHDEAMTELLFGTRAQRDSRNLRHQEPRLPFIHGNICYKPSEIERFNGKVLHYVWDTEVVSNGFVRAVTDPQEYRTFLTESTEHIHSVVAPHNIPGRGHTFYEHINFGGHVLNLGYRHAIPDLTKYTMSGSWFWATSWNDRISSLRTGSGEVILCEHVLDPYLHGDTMTVRANTNVPWIGQAWNDRVSAILG